MPIAAIRPRLAAAATYRLPVGRQVALSLSVRDARGHPVAAPPPAWSTSDPTVVALSVLLDDVVATAITPGVALVRATAGGLRDALAVDTTPPAVEVKIRPGLPRRVRRA
jgi:hypothetical protein